MRKTFNNTIKMRIAKMCQSNDYFGLISECESFLKGQPVGKMTNEYFVLKFKNWLLDVVNCRPVKKLPFTVYTVGNMKLPFLSFSTLPFVTCMGMGECEHYCYSIKAWRQPAAFFRQCQNTMLMHNFDVLAKELKKELKKRKYNGMEKIDFRLYVDGDFSSGKDLKNWMTLLEDTPQVNAYGYSKSLPLFMELHETGYTFPSNYCLNLSNGGKFDFMKEKMMDLDFVRGNFTAVKVAKGENIRDLFENKVFICPNKCGSCTRIGHACGNNDVFAGIEVVIPIH
jgi:hypothetical protein